MKKTLSPLTRKYLQTLLGNKESLAGAGLTLVAPPNFRSAATPETGGVILGPGGMGIGFTSDVLGLLRRKRADAPRVIGMETFNAGFVSDLNQTEGLAAHLVLPSEGTPELRIHDSFAGVGFAGESGAGASWAWLRLHATNPLVSFGTGNVPEGWWDCEWKVGDGDLANPLGAATKDDVAHGTTKSHLGKFTEFLAARYMAGHKFTFISGTNFSNNGRFARAAFRMMARGFERARGGDLRGFEAWVADPQRLGCPDTMIDRIAIPSTPEILARVQEFGFVCPTVVTEETLWWIIEEQFAGAVPPMNEVAGVHFVPHHEVEVAEKLKLTTLNAVHLWLGLAGALKGLFGPFSIYKGMQDPYLRLMVDRIVKLAATGIASPSFSSAEAFGASAIRRVLNPHLPDATERIALNWTSKYLPRVYPTLRRMADKGAGQAELAPLILLIATGLRYVAGKTDEGADFVLAPDPRRELLMRLQKEVALGKPESAAALRPLVADPGIMGQDLFTLKVGQTNVGELVMAQLGRLLMPGGFAVEVAKVFGK
jgi:mannitol-1-phosphate/altronate dehydrogenase